MRSIFFFLCLQVFLINARAGAPAGDCRTSEKKATPAGEVYTTKCEAERGYQETIYVDGTPIVSDNQLYLDDARGYVIIYTGGGNFDVTGCADRMYLLDLSIKPAKLVSFGVKGACNEFHWASWGKSRSVIALKNNVKFIYKDGKIIPPPNDEKLFDNVKAPFGGMRNDSIEPFAENIFPKLHN